MNIKVSSFIVLLTIMGVWFAFSLDIMFGVASLALISVFSFFNFIFRGDKIFSVAYFILFLSFLLAYFIRGFILIQYPDFFLFEFFTGIQINKEDVLNGIWNVIGYFSLMSFGMFIGTKVKFFSNSRVGNKSFLSSNWILNNFNSIIGLLLVLVLGKLLLFFTVGAGMKGEEVESGAVFLLRFIPDDLIFIISTVYLLRYRFEITKRQKSLLIFLIGLMSLSIMLTGSKVFIMLLGLCILIVYLYEQYKLNLAKLIIYTLLSLFLISFSFSAAFVIKYKEPNSIGDFLYQTTDNILSTDPILIAEAVTSRFIGLDGYLLTEKLSSNYVNNGELEESFGLGSTALRIADFILPGRFTNDLATGQAISLHVFGFESDKKFGGAIGLFGALNIAFKQSIWISVIIAGLVLGIGFRKIGYIKDENIRLVIFYFFSYFLVHTFMSGNFDRLIALLIIKIFLLFFYMRIANVIARVKFS